MNIKELLEALKGVDPETKVVLYTDHGQELMLASCAETEPAVLECGETYFQSLVGEDTDDYPDEETIFCISAA